MTHDTGDNENSGAGDEPTPELEHDTATGDEVSPKADLDSSSTPQDGKAPAAEPETIGDEAWLAGFRPLADYVARIGAFQRSFKRYAIYERDNERDDSGYWSEVGSFTIAKDGEITTRGAIDPPTDDERKAIKDGAATVKWPEFVTLAAINKLPDELTGIDEDDDDLFIFRDNTKEKRILMLQQRVEKLDGSGKTYIPWTYWSDGQWRRMEPEGLLPLYGLDHIGDHSTIFLHEGAKAARFVHNLISDMTPEGKARLRAHPWGEALSYAAHLGWIGGAKNPHRTDWGLLKRLSPNMKIYVVADNDAVGVDAVIKISEFLKRPMRMIRFDKSFPPHFDLADEWPVEKSPDGLYAGPNFGDHVFPATWATNLLPNKKGKPTPVIRGEFAQEWVMVGKPPVFIHRLRPDRILAADEFAFQVASFSNTRTVARLLEKVESSKVSGLTYRPFRAHRAHRSDLSDPITQVNSDPLMQVNGVMTFNVFRPSNIGPAKVRNVEGAAKPFLDFMAHLMPDDGDRIEAMRWIATLIARPEVRMRYGMLLISEAQGVGKTTLGSAILAPLLGEWNVSQPDEKMIVDSAFNGWIVWKRLAIVNELYSGTSRKAYDKLKSVVSDDEVEVNEKYIPAYRTNNAVHILACSNSIRALHLDDGDRRWFVPRVTERQHPDGKQFWIDLHVWLKGGGLSIIAAWADDFLRKHEAVGTGDHAPMSSAKQEIIASSRSDGQQLALDLAQRLASFGEERVLIVREVRAWIAKSRGMDINNPLLEKSLTIRKALRDGGLMEPQKVAGRPDTRIRVGGTPEYMVANFPFRADMTWSMLEARRIDPEEFWLLDM
jgi:hypothetical protein